MFQKLLGSGKDKLTKEDEIAAALLGCSPPLLLQQAAAMAADTVPAGGLVSGVPCSVWELTMIQQQNVHTHSTLRIPPRRCSSCAVAQFGGTLFGTPAKLVRDGGVRPPHLHSIQHTLRLAVM